LDSRAVASTVAAMKNTRVISLRPRQKADASAVVSTRLPRGLVEALDLAAASQGLTRAEYLRALAEGGIVRDLDELAHGRRLVAVT
jgi:alkylhydroperoxidase family enzyme